MYIYCVVYKYFGFDCKLKAKRKSNIFWRNFRRPSTVSGFLLTIYSTQSEVRSITRHVLSVQQLQSGSREENNYQIRMVDTRVILRCFFVIYNDVEYFFVHNFYICPGLPIYIIIASLTTLVTVRHRSGFLVCDEQVVFSKLLIDKECPQCNTHIR